MCRPDPGAFLDSRSHLVCQARWSVSSGLDQHCQRLVILAGRDESDGDSASDTNAGQRLQRGLELLGRVVGAAHNDDVLVASGHKELAVLNEPQVAGVQPAVVDRLIGQVGPAK